MDDKICPNMTFILPDPTPPLPPSPSRAHFHQYNQPLRNIRLHMVFSLSINCLKTVFEQIKINLF